MPERKPIGQNPSIPENMQPPSPHCEEWESLIPEALDGTLSAAGLQAFEQHGHECAACAQMLEEARQGVLWLEFLERKPEPPASLLQKILAQTSAAADASAPQASIAAAWVPVWHGSASSAPHARQLHKLIEPRLLMTAAMAFFSLALILNLTGVNLSKIDFSRVDFSGADLSGLRPSALRIHLMRQYYSANAQVVKYYENLRFVYEMETRIRDFERSSESHPEPEIAPGPSLHSPASWNGSARPGRQVIEPPWTASLGDQSGAARAQVQRNMA